eukprot:2723664-Ditylum_brightwellii.AAC.1
MKNVMPLQDQKFVSHVWRRNISIYNNQYSENDRWGNTVVKDPSVGWDLVHDRVDEGEDLFVLAEIQDLCHDKAKESPQ